MNSRKHAWLRTALGAFGFLLMSIASTTGMADPPKHGFPPSLAQLEQAAELTAAFNVGPRTTDLYPANLPFQILYTPFDQNAVNNTGGLFTTFHVRTGTRLYVPVIYNDNSLPIIGDFPPTGDREALLHYIFSQEQFGLDYARITIDGQTTTLGPKHVVQVAFASALPDGGTDYQAIAAILTPLNKGTHTVEISGRVSGDALSVPPISDFFPDGFFEFSTTYTVIVD